MFAFRSFAFNKANIVNYIFWFIALVFLLLTFNALVGKDPVVGVANNGDFWRITSTAGLSSRSQINRYVIDPRYFLGPERETPSYSSTSLIAELSKKISFFFSIPKGEYTIQQMGLTYILLFGLCLFFLAFYLPPWSITLIAWVALDTRYALYMNSFFSFPALFVGVLGIIVVLLFLGTKKEKGHTDISLLNAHMILIALLVWGTLIAAQFITLPLALFLSFTPCLFFISYYTGSGNAFAHLNQFDSIFFGPTLVHDDPLLPLKELNIPDKMFIFARHAYVSPEVILNPSPEVRQIAEDDNISSISKFDIFTKYISSWRVASKTIEMVAGEFVNFHSATHGNFSIPVDPPDKPFIPWWDFYRFRIFLGSLFHPVVLAIFFIFHGLFIGYMAFFSKIKHTPVIVVAIFLYLFTIGQIFVSLLGEGFFGLGRHLLPGAFAYDLCLVFTLIAMSKWKSEYKTQEKGLSAFYGPFTKWISVIISFEILNEMYGSEKI